MSISDAATLTVGSIAVSVEDPGPQVWGQPLVLVADASISGVPASQVGGNVTFYDDTTKLGTRPVNNGQASITTPKLDAGGHDFVAVYNVFHTTVSSDPTVVEISPAPTAITLLRAAPKKITAGDPLTLTGKADVVAPSVGAVISGTITFYVDGTQVASLDVDTAGRLQYVFDSTGLASGIHAITATYDGDTNYQPSDESQPVYFTVQ